MRCGRVAAALVCLGALGSLPVSAAANAGPVPAPSPFTTASAASTEAMDWWGYWTAVGESHNKHNARKFLKQRWHEKFGTSFVMAGIDPELQELPQLVTAARLAQERNVGIVLYLSRVLDHGCAWTRGRGYGEADFAEYDRELGALADALAPYTGTVQAIVGIDDMNGKASLCYFPAPGAPSPVSESMRLIGEHFPEVAYRGHIWMVAGWAAGGQSPPRDAAWLEHSTMLFPYAYHGAWWFDYDPRLVTDCPHRGDLPRSAIEESYASRNTSDLHAFLDWVNAQPGNEGTPALFIAYAAQTGLRRAPAFADGLACTLESTWYHLRCLSAAETSGWATQVRGVLGFAWNSNPTFGALSWLGTAKVPELKRAGRWIGRNRDLCRFSASSDYEDGGGAQDYWHWRYEQCALDLTLSTPGPCTPLVRRDGAAWTTADGTGRFDATTGRPPRDRTVALARGWTAPADGTATIELTVEDLGPSSTCAVETDDGARVAVFADETRVWPASGWMLVRDGAAIDAVISDVAVHEGARIRVVVQRGALFDGSYACDTTRLAPDIDFRW